MSRHLRLGSFFLATALAAHPLPLLDAAPQEASEATYRLREEAEIKEALNQVLSDPEYRRLRRPAPDPDETSEVPEWWQRLEELLRGSDSDSSSPPELSRSFRLPGFLLDWMRWIVYLLVAAVTVAMIILVVKSVMTRFSPAAPIQTGPLGTSRPGTPSTSTPPGELPAEEYASRAIAFAKAANYKAAVRQLLLGGMSWIERQRLIRYRHGLTNREYLRAVSDEPRRREPFRRIIIVFEHVYFGRRRATAEGFKECLEEYRKAFAAD
jgi:hypothetical protein